MCDHIILFTGNASRERIEVIPILIYTRFFEAFEYQFSGKKIFSIKKGGRIPLIEATTLGLLGNYYVVPRRSARQCRNASISALHSPY